MDPFIGQVIMFAGNFAPRGWAFCDGQLLPIAQYSALFSILGTTYGGDGVTTFGLPDLRGRFPLHPGSGPGLPPYSWGQKAGQAETQLTASNLPPHSHDTLVTNAPGDHASPGGRIPATSAGGAENYAAPSSSPVPGGATAPAGNGTPVSNMPPYLGIHFIIALEGIFPSRS